MQLTTRHNRRTVILHKDCQTQNIFNISTTDDSRGRGRSSLSLQKRWMTAVGERGKTFQKQQRRKAKHTFKPVFTS